MSTSPLVSVVTPVHDTAEYLPECIEGVLAQTYSCFEYVIVDNWSRDGSGEIARCYARRDPRVRVVSPPEFLPQVQNYNFALRQISIDSRYVKIAQADDWLFPRCLAELLAVAEQNPRVGIVGAYALRGGRTFGQGLPFPSTTCAGREACRRQLLAGDFLFGSPNQILYRSDMVRGRDPFFPERALHPDTEACYEILHEWDFGFVHQILSFCRWREDSVTGRAAAFNPDALDRYIVTLKYGPDFLQGRQLAASLRAARSIFYAGLANAVFRLERRPFWAYQRDGLARSGLRLERLQLAMHVLLHLANLALNPLTSLGRVRRRLRRRS